MNECAPFIQIEQHSLGISAAAQVVIWVAESGKAGRFCHYISEGFPQWETLCALEDGLIDAKQAAGWCFIVGTLDSDPEVRGWLEYMDWVVMPYGPIRQQAGSDLGLWTRDDFDELEYTIHALADAGPGSGIVINRLLKGA